VLARTKALARAIHSFIHSFTKTHLEMEQAVCCDYQGQYIQYAGHFKNLT